MPCIFVIRGSNLDLEKALNFISFAPYATHRKGERLKRKTDRHHDDFGMKVDVSEDSWNDLSKQFKDAEEFLKRHFEEVKMIEGADSLELDFAYDCRIGTGEEGKEIMVQCDYIPASLVEICGKLSVGIALTQFAPQEEERSNHGSELKPTPAPPA